MKLNIAYPKTGQQKLIEIEDEHKIRGLMDLKMGREFDGEVLGEEFAGYVFRIQGGNDKQGFPMKQGVLVDGRIRLLLKKGMTCYRPRKRGERKRKSVRGCIVASDIAVLHLSIVKKGAAELPGLTDEPVNRRLGPKRASKIRALFALDKTDDVRKYVIRRQIQRPDKKVGEETKPGNVVYKAPKIQRLITPVRLQRKRHELFLKIQRSTKSRAEAEAYNAKVAESIKAAREARQRSVQKRRSVSRRQSEKA